MTWHDRAGGGGYKPYDICYLSLSGLCQKKEKCSQKTDTAELQRPHQKPYVLSPANLQPCWQKTEVEQLFTRCRARLRWELFEKIYKCTKTQRQKKKGKEMKDRWRVNQLDRLHSAAFVKPVDCQCFNWAARVVTENKDAGFSFSLHFLTSCQC